MNRIEAVLQRTPATLKEAKTMKKTIFIFLICFVLTTSAFAETTVYTASLDDESAVDVSGTQQLTLSDVTVQKTDGNASSADAASFRGVNSAIRVYDNAVLTISDSVIEATAQNATGVFAYDHGTIYISDCDVTVTGGGAGGVQVAGGGTLIGSNLTVTSASKAAIRSDRGGGTMILTGGSYTSTGKNGCPAIYSTADITVKDAVCASEQSRAVIIEGKNTVTLENVTIEGNDQSTKEGSVKANVLLYQSASGDASMGTSVFTMTGGEMTCQSGAMFYCTNTDSIINLENAKLNLSDDNTLLIVSAGRWGKDGRNGSDCVLNAQDQTLEGAIVVDGISSLEIHLKNSAYTGAINESSDAGKVAVTLDDDSTWTLAADSYISTFSGNPQNGISNGFTLYINGTALTGIK